MIAPVLREQYSPKKERTGVCVSSTVAGEMPPGQMMGRPFEAYYMSCQCSTICPKQFSKSQPKIITLMWQLTQSYILICSDALKKKKKKLNTHTLFLISTNLIVLQQKQKNDQDLEPTSGATLRCLVTLFYTCS